MPDKKLYHFTHSSPEIRTLADLLANSNSPAFLYNTDPNRFLDIVGDDGITNRQRIENSYTLPEDKIFIGKPYSRLIIKVGTVFYLEFEKVNKPSFLTEGINVVSNDEPAFKAAKLAELEADKGYYQINKPIHGHLLSGQVKEEYPDVSVWIWCRALSNNTDESNELKGELINVTPFILKVITNSSKNGGNFQIQLPPIVCELDKNTNKWILKRETIDRYKSNTGSFQSDEYVAQSNLFHSETFQENENKASDEVLVRNQFYFHNMLSSNDVVFIRFESLDMEKDQRYSDSQEFYINKNNISGRIYDMIGLIDNNNQNVNPVNNDVTININGRDLSKLLIEDGTYFYALENSQGILKFAGQSTQKNSLVNRIFADNGMSFIGLYQFTSIEYILKFIIQQLSNIKIVPDNLFDSYGERRNKTFTDYDIDGADAKKMRSYKIQGLGKINELRVAAGKVDSIPSVEDNTTNEIFKFVVDFLRVIRNENKRLINKVNTIKGWKSFIYKNENLEENQIPEYLMKSLFNDKGEFDEKFYHLLNITDNYIDAAVQKKRFKEKLAAGIWQIVDLVIDKTVASRRLADSSFSTSNGSLLNFIQSAVQEPLCEFYMDTYGDKYNLIVRRPPYDQKALISLIEGKVNTETGKVITPPAVVDVLPEDVLQENLSYDDSQVYSWYHFFPRNAMIGDAQNYSLSYLGALYFPEYADVFGSKAFQQSNSYIPYVSIKNSNDTGLGIDEAQAIEDLKYVVESSQYLPFTRKGTLTLNRDRRLKIGNILRYKSTGEIFFIEGVQHSFTISDGNIDAITTVQVTRGMIEQLIYGQFMLDQNKQPKFVSYFNIIDTRLVINKKEIEKKVVKQIKKGTSVNSSQTSTVNVFTPANFIIDNFLKGSQVIEQGKNTGLGNLEKYNEYPKNKNLFINFINLINKAGYWVHITSRGTNRTYAQQAALKKENPNNADPGHSKHEKGSAIDITLIDKKTGVVHSKTTDKAAWIKTGVPEIAKLLGLRWAGGEGSFGSYVDRVHFEIAVKTEQISLAQETAEEYEEVTETIKSFEVDRSGIFQNFKVDKFIFNFFLKRLQNSPEFRNVTSRKIYDNGGELLSEIKVQSKIK